MQLKINLAVISRKDECDMAIDRRVREYLTTDRQYENKITHAILLKIVDFLKPTLHKNQKWFYNVQHFVK